MRLIDTVLCVHVYVCALHVCALYVCGVGGWVDGCQWLECVLLA